MSHNWFSKRKSQKSHTVGEKLQLLQAVAAAQAGKSVYETLAYGVSWKIRPGP